MTTSPTRHLVDPQLLGLLDSMPPVALNETTLPLMRAAPSRFEVDPADVARTIMETRKIPGPEGAPEVPVTVYRPVGAKGALPCILHIHGGGYVLGSAASQESVHRPLAAELGCCIVSVDYRLAPVLSMQPSRSGAYFENPAKADRHCTCRRSNPRLG